MQVTVGICAFNEDKNIGQLLESVLNEQELPSESEVLVVCSGCTDDTVEIAQDYAKKDHRINVFVEENRTGKASAVNKILQNARGTNIIFISADTLPNRNCFQNLTSKLQDSQAGIVCGKPIPVKDPKSLVGRMVQALWLFHDHVFIELNDAGLARHASEVFCIRKGIVHRIPPETVNDDAYIAVTAKKKGWLIKYEPHAFVSISGPKTLADYIRQRRRIIFGHYQIRKLTGESPQYLVHLAPQHPKKVLQLAFWLVTQSGILTFSIFAEIELLLNATAIIDTLMGKTYTQWSIAASTKTVPRESNRN